MRSCGKWLAALAIFPLAAQNAPSAQESQFRIKVTNIQVDVTADYQGKSLLNLTTDDFAIRDEGQSRPILSFEESTVPLDLILVIDTGLEYRLDKKKSTSPGIVEVVADAMKQMRPVDRVGVISFTSDPKLELPLTGIPGAAVSALNAMRNASATPPSAGAFHPLLALQWAGWMLQADPVSMGFAQQATPAVRKRAVVAIVRDAQDALGWIADEPGIQQYWSLDTVLHAVILTPTEGGPTRVVGERVGNVAHITLSTGGEVIKVASDNPFEKALPDLLARIQSSYTLFYAPPAAKSGETRHIAVELSDEAKKKYPGAVIHAREGYIAK